MSLVSFYYPSEYFRLKTKQAVRTIATYFETLGAFLQRHEQRNGQHGRFVDKGGFYDGLYGISFFREKLISWGIGSPDNLPPIFDYSHEGDSPIPDLTDFHRTIVKSTSFMWLIDSIRESHSTLMLGTPRRTFLEAVFDHLVPTTASYRVQLIKGYEEALFCFHDWPLWDDTRPGTYLNKLFPSVVITHSRDDAQAVSIDDYISQAWQSSCNTTIFSQLRSSCPLEKVAKETRVGE